MHWAWCQGTLLRIGTVLCPSRRSCALFCFLTPWVISGPVTHLQTPYTVGAAEPAGFTLSAFDEERDAGWSPDDSLRTFDSMDIVFPREAVQ